MFKQNQNQEINQECIFSPFLSIKVPKTNKDTTPKQMNPEDQSSLLDHELTSGWWQTWCGGQQCGERRKADAATTADESVGTDPGGWSSEVKLRDWGFTFLGTWCFASLIEWSTRSE